MLALAIFCLAASSALVATLLNRTSESQAGFDEESYIVRNEPGLHLREETQLPEKYEFEMHFARRRSTKGFTLRKPPFFSVTARPRAQGTATPFPWTVPWYPGENTEITEATDQYPDTVPGEVTEPPDPPTLTPASVPDFDNSTADQSDEPGNATEHAKGTDESTASEITQTEDHKSTESTEKESSADVESSSQTASEEASSSETTEAASRETESSVETTEAASKETGALLSTEEKGKPNARILDVYDDNNFDMLRKLVPLP